MTSRKLILFLLVVLLSSLFIGAPPAAADSSHARIIRLSLVQGDVRFARQTHGDPLSDSSATWETVSLNLPIRQGYVLATDKGRAEVEFENGAMAFLKENTVLEFYDLSLNDSARTTRLVPRQGSGSFYVNPAGGDYFSVTGGDFTVEASTRTRFRLDNFDDGSTVEAYQGRVSVLHHKNKNETRLEKGQSLSMKAGDDSSLNVGRLPEEDDFDRWVSGRIDSVSNATSAALQYTGSPYYAPGFADLYTYGAFSNCGSYGYGWRPFGAGLVWSPFTNGQWIMDPSIGWTWVSFQPWGWAPYHYGGWLFDASCGGWFYSPPVLYGYTAYPVDQKGKTPLNLERGVFSGVGMKGVSSQLLPVAPGQKWETLKAPPRDALSGNLAVTAPPIRVSRTFVEGQSGIRAGSPDGHSTIAFDPVERRFVNTNSSSPSSSAASSTMKTSGIHVENGRTGTPTVTPSGVTPPRAPVNPPASRSASSTPPPRNIAPPPAPRYSSGDRGGSSSGSGRGGSWGGGSSSSSSAGAGASGRSSSSPSPSSSPPASHPSSGSGRPH